MPKGAPRLAMWALLAVLLVATLAAPMPGARAANPANYVLTGYVTTAGNFPVPSGVTVILINGATHDLFTTQTVAGGSFNFTTRSTNGQLVPGTWGVWVPPQSNLSLRSCHPYTCDVLPTADAPAYTYQTAQNLTSTSSSVTITGVSVLKNNATLTGIAKEGGSPAAGADVELLAPGFDAYPLANNTTGVIGNFSLKVPWGTWVLRTTEYGTPDQFDYQQVVVAASNVSINPQVSKYLTYGTVYQAAHPSAQVPYGGNVTVYDVANHYVYSSPTLNGGFYDFGTYPSGFSGSGANSFDVAVQSIGYQTMWYPLTVSGANTTGTLPHNLWAPAQYAPAVYQTSLNYSTNFKWLNTSTTGKLANDSVFPEIANASIGQLWGQLALDWQHNLTFDAANLPTVQAWVQSGGPFFPAGSAQANVNGLGYNESSVGGTFTWNAGCSASFCGLSSGGGINYGWTKAYSLNGSAPSNATSYNVSFLFRHPTNVQSINYTVSLPSGYALQAGTSAPAQARLVANGPNGTWTKFTLVSLPSGSLSGKASFTFVKYGKITANVNVTSTQFAFSKRNVLNSTHGNYSVIVGVGQNVSFSGASSTFPSGINGSRYVWSWGDASSNTNSTQPTSYHTYAAAKEYNGSLSVISSGGTSASVAFHVWAGNGGVKGSIVSNASSAQTRNASGTTYLMVNSSTTLHFNATGFASSLFGSSPGFLSVASWNATFGPKNSTSNFTAASAAYVPDNFTVTFSAGGDTNYLSSATINGQAVSFLGWQYNVTVRVWDCVGSYATQELIVLVQDKQAPTAVATVQDNTNKNITSSGVVEASNHTAEVRLVSQYSSDPNGGSLVWYNWTVRNSGNTTINGTAYDRTLVNRSGYRAPAYTSFWLPPQVKPYQVNLTVTDRAGNHNYNQVSVTVAINTSTRPVLAVGNLSAPSSMTDGTSYTVFVNVTNTLGQNSTALGVQVHFYLLPPSGSGSQLTIGGSPASVTFLGIQNGTLNGTTMGTGSVNLRYNETVRAQISFNPDRTGTFNLWANATATNEFGGDYATGGNQAHVQVTLNQNPIVLYEEIVGIVAVIIVAIVLVILYSRGTFRRGARSGGSSRSGLDRSGGKKDGKSDSKPADDDEDDE